MDSESETQPEIRYRQNIMFLCTVMYRHYFTSDVQALEIGCHVPEKYFSYTKGGLLRLILQFEQNSDS